MRKERMNLLITGSKGQLGSEFKKLSEETTEHNFTFIDIEELDLTKTEDVQNFVANNKFDILINCAAYTAVDKAETEQELATKINCDVPTLLAKLSTKHSFSLIHISTDFVFDGKKEIPYNEDDTPAPLSVYGKTKLAGERGVIEFAKKAIIIRTSWLYSNFGNNFVKTISRLGAERDELKIVADQYGTPTNARDLASAILTITSHENFSDASMNKEIFHYSDQGMTSWYHFTREIFALQNIACTIVPIATSDYSTEATRPKYSVLNKNKIYDIFDLSIKYWRNSLKNLYLD